MKTVILEESNEGLYFNLFNMYLYEMSQYDKNIIESIDANGVLYKKLQTHYYLQDMYKKLLLFENDSPAGIIILSDHVGGDFQHEINEVFFLPPYRGGKYSYNIILNLIRKKRGTYRILILKENTIARKFWKNTMNILGVKYVMRDYSDVLDAMYFTI